MQADKKPDKFEVAMATLMRLGRESRLQRAKVSLKKRLKSKGLVVESAESFLEFDEG